MKRKWIVIALLLIGIALLCVPVVLAIRETGNTDIIGGAGLHSFPFIFFSPASRRILFQRRARRVRHDCRPSGRRPEKEKTVILFSAIT